MKSNYLALIAFIFVLGFIIYMLASSSSSFIGLLSVAFKSPATSTLSTSPNQPPIRADVQKKSPEKTEISVSVNKPPVTPPAGFTVEQLSPYYQKIRISSVYRPSYYSSDPAQINLSAYYLTDPINLTGWMIKGNRSELPILPRVINDYHPYGLVGEEELVLVKNDQLHIFSGRSPVSFNFRLNKCTGFLNDTYVFRPKLPNNCPAVDRKEIVALSGRCQSYIMSLTSCQAPKSGNISAFSQPEEAACRAILDKINYGGCYFQHRGDADFFSRDIRVWFDYAFSFDSQHDRVMLFDRSGLLVDQYVY